MLDTNFLSGGNKGDGRNLFVMGTAAPKGMYLIPGGEMTYTSDNGVRCSDYISVSPGEKITVHIIGTSLGVDTTTFWSRLTWYSAEKAYMSEQTLDNSESEKTPKYFDIYRTFTVPSGVAYTRVSARLYDDGRIKVERGSIATDWTPAPEDVLLKGEADGRNLVLNSKINATTKDYRIARLNLSEKLEKNKTYTIALFGAKFGATENRWGITSYDGAGEIVSLTESDNRNGVYSKTFTIPETYNQAYIDHQLIEIFGIPNNGEESTIGAIKIELGINPNPKWTPAPEDVATHADVEQAVTGENLLRGVNNPVLAGSGAWANGEWRAASEEGTRTPISVSDCPNSSITNGWRLHRTASSGSTDICQDAIPVKANQLYVLSCYVKGTGSLRLQYYNGSKYNNTIHSVNSGTWIRIQSGFYLDNVTSISAYFGSADSSDLDICGMKLEKGSSQNTFATLHPIDQFFYNADFIPEMHRNIFRGKNLGTVFTDEQKANIKNGTFHDLWLGDYWVINGHTWRIVDINYWYNKGDTTCTTPHIVVMPDAILYSHKMNNDNVTTGGYYGSLMYTEGLTEAKNIVNTDFGEGFVLKHRILLINKVDSGHASVGTWYDSTVELANEIMIYGCLVFSAMNNGTAVPYLHTTECTQLALFRLVPRFINISRQWYWLRDVVSAASFADVYLSGGTNWSNASLVGGVRPVVGITGGTASADEPDDDLEVAELSSKGDDPL